MLGTEHHRWAGCRGIAAGLAVACLAATAQAQIYAKADPNSDSGTIILTNVPEDRSYAVVVAAPPSAAPAAKAAGEPPPELQAVIQEASVQQQVDPALVRAVMRAESAYNAKAVSPKGAKGLMQLMPATASRFGVKDIFDARENVHGGARYLRHLLDLFGNNLELALAAYNAGESAVIKAGYKVPDFPETKAYVPRVIGLYHLYRG